jgi:uncharacterized protein (DUF3084 family)
MTFNITLVYFCLLIPLAGFIAWAGDRIGHKSGKKRHSLFGLRPRHTAMVFTIGAGMAIVIASFGVFWLGSEGFRIVVRDGAELYNTNRRLKADNILQVRVLDEQRKRVDTLKAEVARFTTEREGAARELLAAKQARDSAKEGEQAAINRVFEAQAHLTETQRRLQVARVAYDQAKSGLAQTQAKLQAKTKLFNQAEARLQGANQRAQIASRRAQNAEARQTTALQAQHRQARKINQYAQVLDEQAKRLQRQNKQLADQENELQARQAKIDEKSVLFTEQEKRITAQRGELQQLGAELAQKRREYDTLVSNTTALRRHQITYQIGEEVDRFPIRAGYNVWRLQAILSASLTQAGRKAEKRGAAKAGQDRAIFIAPRLVTQTTPRVSPVSLTDDADEEEQAKSGGLVALTENELIRAAADRIRLENKDVVVVVKAVSNAVAGEPVAVDFVIYPNPVVLGTKQPIGEVVLFPSGAPQEWADKLQAFLVADIHRKLLNAGMIPVTRRGDEANSSVATGLPEEFSLSGDDWLNLLDEIRRSGQRVRVRVFAAHELRAGDPIALRFEVKPAP